MNRRVGALKACVRAAAFGAWLGLAAAGAMAQSKLNVYNWSDYIGETTIKDFEHDTGIKVRYDTFDANETLYAKLVAGRTGYDIVVPSVHWAKLQIDGGLFLKLDKSKIPNLKNLDPWAMQQLATVDPGNQYLVPWMWGITTLGINVAKVKAALGSLPMPDNAWDLLFKPEYVSKLKSCGVSVMDSGDEIFPAALRYLNKEPYSTNSADYQDAARLLKAIRPSVTMFSSSSYINELASGNVCLAMGWNGDIGIAAQRAREAKNGQNVQILVPKTGAILFFDTMAIPADAANVDSAYKWINFILKPENQAGIVNKVFYANPVRAADALIKPEVSGNRAVFLQGPDLAKMVPPNMVNSDTRRLRTRLFTSFKTGV